MNVAGEKTIKTLYVKLRNTSAADKIADYLLTKDIVSFEALEDIHSRRTDYEKWGVILSVVRKSRKADTFGIFVNAIEEADESLEGLATELRGIKISSMVSNSVVLVRKNLFSNSYSYLNDDRIRILVFIVCSHFLNVSYSYSFCFELQLVLVLVIVLVTVMMCVLNVLSTIIMLYIHSS